VAPLIHYQGIICGVLPHTVQSSLLGAVSLSNGI
jgi:hypothetical protein